jgi:hypothetical protein
MDIYNTSDDVSGRMIEESNQNFDETSRISSISENSVRFHIRMLKAMLPSTMSSDDAVQRDIPIPSEISVMI